MALPVTVVNPVMMNHHTHHPQHHHNGGAKDSRWLTLDVCREFTRNKCARSEDECRFAHPTSNVEVQNGKVICCFDSIKGKCQRNDPPCKYLHPPQHLKEQLLQNGRKNLILRHIQTQFIVNGMQRILPVHPFAATNGARFGSVYSPAYTPFPSLLPSEPPGVQPGNPPCSFGGEEVVMNNSAVGVEGESTAPISTSQNQHQVWSGAGTPPTSMVTIDSNGYITSYCSPYVSPMYYQRPCPPIPGVLPMVKPDGVGPTDAKYDLSVYPQPPPCLTYPHMMISSSSMPYATPQSYFMIPGPVTSAIPRY